MVDFVDEMVAPADEQAAEKLSLALNGKGAFRRFKDTLHRVDEQWLQAWYRWRNKRLEAALDEWLKGVLQDDGELQEVWYPCLVGFAFLCEPRHDLKKASSYCRKGLRSIPLDEDEGARVMRLRWVDRKPQPPPTLHGSPVPFDGKQGVGP